MATVERIREVSIGEEGDWQLSFQWCRYHYDDGTNELGYRFIWIRENGNLQAARGQARIPSADELEELIRLATEAGWYRTVENE